MDEAKLYSSKILIVDDTIDNLELIEDFLDDEGYTNIIGVSSAKEAYKVLEKNDIDLIILDIMMPEISGLEACKFIKSQENYHDISIIFATAKTDMQTLKDGFDAGAIDYVKKPITNEVELLSRVKNALILKHNLNRYKELNIALDKRVKEEIELRKQIKEEQEMIRKQELQIVESTKMAQMGEMIGNIAHQWRQPLSVISTIASGMILEQDINVLSEERLVNYCKIIMENTEYLSETIDTFRDFIREKKERKDVILQDRINVALNIVTSSLENNHIKLISNVNYEEPIKINVVIGELSQVIINIISNARDILKESNKDNGWVKLDCIKKDNTAIITIEDNGGGIPDDIIGMIFDPYFTTKHKSQGTGLGLHMSKRIIKESFRGDLYVKNTENGAKFYIELPLV